MDNIIHKKYRRIGVIDKGSIKAFLLLFPFIEVHVFNVGSVYNISVMLASLYVLILFLRKKIIFKKEYIPIFLYSLLLVA